MDVELLVEGYTDELFVRRCYGLLEIQIGTVYGKHGAGYIIEKAAAFAIRGQFSPILILADLMDMPVDCPNLAKQGLVPQPTQHSLVRFAVREIESWVLASGQELARYFAVSETHIPADPDSLIDPKQELINIARRSPRRRLRDMFVPKEGASAVVGTGYVDGFSEFMESHWRLESAIESSPSFARFVQRSNERFKNQ